MPIYEYECAACDHQVEVLQKISDPLLTDCPACGKDTLRKCVSAPSFRLKGSGWYETDFKTGKQKNLAGDSAAKADKPGPDSGGGKDKAAAGSGGAGSSPDKKSPAPTTSTVSKKADKAD